MIDPSCFLLTSTSPFDTLRCWQRSADGSPSCALYRSWQSRREASLTTLTNLHRQSGSPWQRLCIGLSLLDWWYFLLGLALHLCQCQCQSQCRCYAILTLLRPKAEHRDRGSSSHICTHESQKPEFGHLGSRCHSGKWESAVGLIQNFKGADLICCILSFCSLQDQTSQHRFPGRSLWEQITPLPCHATVSIGVWVQPDLFSPSCRCFLFPTHCVSHAVNDVRQVHTTYGRTRANAEPCRAWVAWEFCFTPAACRLPAHLSPNPLVSGDQERYWLLCE